MCTGIKIESVSKSFGGIHALKNINLDIPYGENYGILGTNGAGKTTLFNIISGNIIADSGCLFYNNINITKFTPTKISRLGIKRTFQEIMLFGNLTVEENILLGLLDSINYDLNFDVKTLRYNYIDRICVLLEKFDLNSSLLKKSIFELPYGIRKIVELIRIILSDHRFILLDEPTSGLTTKESVQMLDVLSLIKEEGGVTFIIIDHNLNFLFKICSQFSFMDNGEVVFSGNKDNLLSNIPILHEMLF